MTSRGGDRFSKWPLTKNLRTEKTQRTHDPAWPAELDWANEIILGTLLVQVAAAETPKGFAPFRSIPEDAQ